MAEKRYTLPMIPLRGLTIFPYMVIHFDIGREKSIKALEEAFMKNQLIFVTTQKDPELEDPSIDDVYKVGTITKVKQMLKLPGELIRVLVEGISRGEIDKVTREDEFFEVEVVEKEEQTEIEKTPELEALMRSVISSFEEYVNMTSRVPIESLYSVISIEEPGRLADMIAAHISLSTAQNQ
ncbi:MAG: LON peptidase substrate-binding domain-containing protein, partial [Caldanaerobacter sp.]